jgi:putative nucleotidyltransferase with HDIG domain
MAANAVIIDWGDSPAALAFISDITERRQVEEELKKGHQKQQKALEEVVNVLAAAVEKRDPYTAGHEQRVARLASAIASEMGLTSKQVQGIDVAASLHDIGKINVPIEILTKPGGINQHERGIVQMHPQVGYDIIKEVEFPWPVAQAMLQHHERLDGSGYPAGISGEAIIIEARVLAVADVVEAMLSHRPYREALGVDKALGEIRQNRGVLYDSQVADACLRLFDEKGFELE